MNYSVDGGAVVQQSWTGILTPLTEAVIILGVHTFPTTGISTIKAWTSNPNGNTDPDHTNDTLSQQVLYQPTIAVPFNEHFDSAWIDRLSTHDVPSDYWYNQPVTATIPGEGMMTGPLVAGLIIMELMPYPEHSGPSTLPVSIQQEMQEESREH